MTLPVILVWVTVLFWVIAYGNLLYDLQKGGLVKTTWSVRSIIAAVIALMLIVASLVAYIR